MMFMDHTYSSREDFMTPQYEIDAIAFIEDRDVTFVYVVRYEPDAVEAWHDIQKIIAQHVTGYTPYRGAIERYSPLTHYDAKFIVINKILTSTEVKEMYREIDSLVRDAWQDLSSLMKSRNSTSKFYNDIHRVFRRML